MAYRKGDGQKLIEITGAIKHETDAAYRFDDGTKVVWLPKSQCQWDSDAKEMTMPEWLALDKGLI